MLPKSNSKRSHLSGVRALQHHRGTLLQYTTQKPHDKKNLSPPRTHDGNARWKLVLQLVKEYYLPTGELQSWFAYSGVLQTCFNHFWRRDIFWFARNIGIWLVSNTHAGLWLKVMIIWLQTGESQAFNYWSYIMVQAWRAWQRAGLILLQVFSKLCTLFLLMAPEIINELSATLHFLQHKSNCYSKASLHIAAECVANLCTQIHPMSISTWW